MTDPEIKEERHRGRQLCDHCAKHATVKFSVKIKRKVHTAYGCPDHKKRAKQSLEGSW